MLAVLSQALLAALRARLPGNHAATPDTIQRRFLVTPARSSPAPTPSQPAWSAARLSRLRGNRVRSRAGRRGTSGRCRPER
jgi:hypothetical protein